MTVWSFEIFAKSFVDRFLDRLDHFVGTPDAVKTNAPLMPSCQSLHFPAVNQLPLRFLDYLIFKQRQSLLSLLSMHRYLIWKLYSSRNQFTVFTLNGSNLSISRQHSLKITTHRWPKRYVIGLSLSPTLDAVPLRLHYALEYALGVGRLLCACLSAQPKKSGGFQSVL